MKKSIFTFLFMAIAHLGLAQSDSVRFEITISDPAAITSYSAAGIPIFSSSSINSILASYYITEFLPAYPSARHQYLRNVYQVRCNNYVLAAALKTANPKLFPFYERISAALPLGYTPNDMHLWYTKYLKYINAEDAWGITQGDPNVIIGVTDTYFDMTHPDLFPKVASIGPNTYPGAYFDHGTFVAGIAAGATDNAQGYPAIGFNCRLDLSNNWASDEEMLSMSRRGIRIINGSWTNGNTPSLNLRNYFYKQGLYNEVYENGTFTCIPAGNGIMTSPDPSHFSFPASYDHIMSTTNVGWEHDYPGTFNVKGVHETNVGSLAQCFQHNSKVDICAPAIRIGGLTYDPSNLTKKYVWDSFWGTSAASPMVAGTAGLIQSALKHKHGPDANYSPYQLEWILKWSANPDMLSLPENAPYAGRLGVGRLDAAKAVQKVVGISTSALNPNDAATQTMYIKGIDINTICAPGFASNGVLPKLKPIIVNGTAPYTYVWEQVPDGTNTAILDNENIAEPTITGIKSGATTYLLYYRLTVYDASPTAQKVAMKTFKIKLKTSGYDLAMRDSYVDMLNEPNDQRIFDPRELDTWTSPDIWNRQAADGGLEHQNPEYFVTDPNHLYTRIRNVGCAASPSSSKLRTYWTKASTGENWDVDWTVRDVAAASGPPIAGGREITTGSGINIPLLHPGATTIIHQTWYPINPLLYYGTPSTFEVCFLARIEEAIGMAIPEKFSTTPSYIGVGENIRNNNNIVTRNTILTNLRPDNIKTMKRQLVIANGNNVATTYNFEFASERSIFRHFAGDFSSLGSVTLHLGSLYDVWVNAGGVGTVASQNAQNQTVTFDGANTLRLEGIPLAANQRYTIDVEFTLDSPVVVNEVSHHVFHARQFDVATPDEVYGAVNYHVMVSPATQNNQRKTLEEGIGATETYQLSPNPTTGIISITYRGDKENASELVVTDMVGKKIMSDKISFSPGVAKEINLSRFATGIYLINISNANGKTELYKVVKE